MNKTAKQGLDLVKLFKIFANETRLSILMLLKDNYLTPGEISRRLGLGVSLVYKHLDLLKKEGIIKEINGKGEIRFDFSSPHLFKMLEEASEALSEIKGMKVLNGGSVKFCGLPRFDELVPDKILDMRGEVCPVPDIQTRKAVNELNPGEILLVVVDYPLSVERIPVSIKKEGHELIGILREGAEARIFIRRRR